MKKFICLALALFLCAALTGCTQSNAAVINNVSKNLDRVTNTVSGIERQQENIVDGFKKVDKIAPNRIEKFKSLSKIGQPTPSIERLGAFDGSEDYIYLSSDVNLCLEEIKKETELLKVTLGRGPELSDDQKRAVTELANNISINCSRINMAKSEVQREASGIGQEFKKGTKNTNLIDAKFIKLSNAQSTRLSHCENLLVNLKNINQILSDALPPSSSNQLLPTPSINENSNIRTLPIRPKQTTPNDIENITDPGNDSNSGNSNGNNHSNIQTLPIRPKQTANNEDNDTNSTIQSFPNQLQRTAPNTDGNNNQEGIDPLPFKTKEEHSREVERNSNEENQNRENSYNFKRNRKGHLPRNVDTYLPGYRNIDTYRNYGPYPGGFNNPYYNQTPYGNQPFTNPPPIAPIQQPNTQEELPEIPENRQTVDTYKPDSESSDEKAHATFDKG